MIWVAAAAGVLYVAGMAKSAADGDGVATVLLWPLIIGTLAMVLAVVLVVVRCPDMRTVDEIVRDGPA